jgi:hypothetical protein
LPDTSRRIEDLVFPQYLRFNARNAARAIATKKTAFCGPGESKSITTDPSSASSFAGRGLQQPIAEKDGAKIIPPAQLVSQVRVVVANLAAFGSACVVAA